MALASRPAARRKRPAASARHDIHDAPPRTLRPAFYALGSGRRGDLLALLHPPYTAWHLSYFALGAAVAPHLYLNRLLWGLAAFGLAVGVAAHALDELHDRPLGTSLSERTLIALAATSLLGALAIGVAGVVTVSVWLAPLVLAGGAVPAGLQPRAGRWALSQRSVVRDRLGSVPGLHRLLRERRDGSRSRGS